jgi:glycosyltransferase involved in cell wall biosynthesis
MQISVVIPTYNRKQSLLRLLKSLSESDFLFVEVIVVDSGIEKCSADELRTFDKLKIKYLSSPPSVCLQRNTGIGLANGEWIFLCDDDIEVPPNYISQLANHLKDNKLAGAASGLVLQKDDNDKWQSQYPITKNVDLFYRFIFCAGMWGSITVKKRIFNAFIINYYQNKGNHLSKAGWPVLTNFKDPFFNTPIYGLGASLIKKEWLVTSPFEEALDANGYGENYGVAKGFPHPINVVSSAFVYHHHEKSNRQKSWLTEQKRTLALHFFLKINKNISRYATNWLLWSIVGKIIYYFLKLKWKHAVCALETFLLILINRNPYILRKQRAAKG